ncbi:MAG: hypothetical protein JHC24_03470 [Thaumarchaeota archaeon]|nr:hypothetical protein [Nitrososphaerota archaeon]
MRAAKEARRPGRPSERSGYVQVRKVEGKSKQLLLRELAKELARIRGAAG